MCVCVYVCVCMCNAMQCTLCIYIDALDKYNITKYHIGYLNFRLLYL